MLKKIAVIGGIAAVAGLGLGGAAWAESNSPAPQAVAATSQGDVSVAAATTTPAAPSSTGKGAKGRGSKGKGARTGHRADLARRLEKVVHAQWVTKDGKTGTFVTHDAVRGSVSAVTAGSITIKATDGTSETFAVNSTTKVNVKGTAGTIAQVKVGDQAGVLGTGAATMTATRVIDRGVPKPTTTTAPTTS